MDGHKKGDVSRRDFGVLLGAFGGVAGIVPLAAGAQAATATGTTAGSPGESPGEDGEPERIEFPRPLAAAVVADVGDVGYVDPIGLLPTGAILFVDSLRAYFMLDRESTLAADATYVIAAAANSRGNWVRMPQGDLAGNVTIASGQSIFKKQGGTPANPALEVLFKLEPQPQPDGTLTAPFAAITRGALANGFFDPVFELGYNPANVFTDAEPQAAMSFEGGFRPGSGPPELTEIHIVQGQAPSTGSVMTRVFSSSMYREDGTCSVGLSFNAPAGAANVNGAFITNAATGARYLQMTGGTADFIALGNNPASSGSLRLSSAVSPVFDRGIAWKANLGAWDYQIWTNPIDQLIVGAVSAGSQGGFTDIIFNTRTTAQGGSSVVPAHDNDVSLGTSANRWKLIRGNTITSGDLDLYDEAVGAHWTLREETDCILAINRVTDQWYKLPLVPLTDEERAKYGARPLNNATAEDAARTAPTTDGTSGNGSG